MLDDVAVTLLSVKESTGTMFSRPGEGNIFVICEFDIENNSSSDLAISSLMSFDCYCDGYSKEMNLTATIMEKGSKSQLDGSIPSGKKMNGVIGFEVPEDWNELEIKFTPNYWRGNEMTFVAKHLNVAKNNEQSDAFVESKEKNLETKAVVERTDDTKSEAVSEKIKEKQTKTKETEAKETEAKEIETEKIETEKIEISDTEEKETESETIKKVTTGEKNALQAADSYLSYAGGFSEKSLRRQLEFTGFEKNEIDYAIENCGADWKKECLSKAKSYLSFSGFSEQSLRKQLDFEGFLKEEIDYAIENCGADWKEQCLSKAESYLSIGGFSKQSLRNQLEFEGFLSDEIDYALNILYE